MGKKKEWCLVKTEQAVTRRRAAELLGLPPARLRKLIATGELKTTKTGGAVMVPNSEVDRLLSGKNLKKEIKKSLL